ncbi:hypothetical protein Tco_0431058 [Tanacetum coccineum]
MKSATVVLGGNVTSQRCWLGFARQLHALSPGTFATISLILGLPLGAVAPEVAWSPTLEANNGICICPLGSWVVVVTVVVVIVVAVVVVCAESTRTGSYSTWPGDQVSLQLVHFRCT